MTPAGDALRKEDETETPDAAAGAAVDVAADAVAGKIAAAINLLHELAGEIRLVRQKLRDEQQTGQHRREKRTDDLIAMLHLDAGLSKDEIVELLGIDNNQRKLYGILTESRKAAAPKLIPEDAWHNILAMINPPRTVTVFPATKMPVSKPYADTASLTDFLLGARTQAELGRARQQALFAGKQRFEAVNDMAGYLLAETALTPKEVRQLLGIRRKHAHLYPLLDPAYIGPDAAESVLPPEAWRAIHTAYKRGPDPRLEMAPEQLEYIVTQWNGNPHWSARQVLRQVNAYFAESWGNLELTQAGLRQLRKRHKALFEKRPAPPLNKKAEKRLKFPPKSRPKDEVTRLFLQRTKRPRIRSPYWRLRDDRREAYLQVPTPLPVRLTQFVVDHAHAGKNMAELLSDLAAFDAGGTIDMVSLDATLREFGYRELTYTERKALQQSLQQKTSLAAAVDEIIGAFRPNATGTDDAGMAEDQLAARWPVYREMLKHTHDHEGIGMFHRVPHEAKDSKFINAVRIFLGDANIKDDVKALLQGDAVLRQKMLAVLPGSQGLGLVQAVNDVQRLVQGNLSASVLEPLSRAGFMLFAAYLQQRGFFAHYPPDSQVMREKPKELPPPPSEARVFTLIDRRPKSAAPAPEKSVKRLQTRGERLHELPDAAALQALSDNYLALRAAYLQGPRDEAAILAARAFFTSDTFKEKILPYAAVDQKYLLGFLAGKFAEWEAGYDACSWDIPPNTPNLSAWQEETWVARRRYIKSRRAQMSRVPLIPADAHHDPLNVMEITRDHASYYERMPHIRGTRRSARAVKHLLKSGQNNAKLGGHVRVGALAAYAFYSVSLPQRETCGSSCVNWAGCYVDHMKDTHLFVPNADYRARLEEDVNHLATALRQEKRGLLLRMHPAGDFYSVEYVALVGKLLAQHPNLAVWGLSQRTPSDHLATYLDVNQLMSQEEWDHHRSIGDALAKLQRDFPHQMFLHLSSPVQLPGTAVTSDINPHAKSAGPVAIKAGPNAVWCLAEVGKQPDCAHCGVCFSRGTLRPIHGKAVLFTRHGRTPPNTANHDNLARQIRNKIARRDPARKKVRRLPKI